MHIAGSQPARATLRQERFLNLPGFRGLRLGEELLRWHSEEFRDLPSKKHIDGRACVHLVERLLKPSGGFPQAWR